MTSPTARTLAECKRRGYHVQVVERFCVYSKRRIDLFGCIDLVAITPEGIMGIQATSGTNHSARREKANEEPRIAAWIAAGGLFEIWSFAKRGDRDKRKLWALRAERISRLPEVSL